MHKSHIKGPLILQTPPPPRPQKITLNHVNVYVCIISSQDEDEHYAFLKLLFTFSIVLELDITISNPPKPLLSFFAFLQNSYNWCIDVGEEMCGIIVSSFTRLLTIWLTLDL